MPLTSFRVLPKNIVEWSRFFQSLVVTPDPNSVVEASIADAAVVEAKLAALAVTASKIASEAVDATKLATDAVTEVKLAAASVTETKLGSSSVTSTKISNSAVTYDKLQNVSATDRVLGRQTAGAGVVEEITCTAAGRALIDDADATAQRTTLGLGTAATQNTGTSGATVPLLDGTNVHASGQFTAFGVGTTATQQAANADTSGATLSELETEVNELKAVLRAFGLIAT